MKLTKIAGLGMLMSAAIGMLGVSSAQAQLMWSSPLTINQSGIVGAADGITGDGGTGTGNPAVELIIAQDIFEANQQGYNGGAITVDSGYVDSKGNAQTFLSSSTDYGDPTIITSSATSAYSGADYVGPGFDYVIAKYDGQNGGYVLFYLGGQAADLPTASETIYGDAGTGQYGISGFVAFNVTPSPVPEAPTIIAGALMLLPLGVGAIRAVRKERTLARIS